MNSIIIVSKNQEYKESVLNRIYREQGINSVDQDTSTFDKAVGIQDVISIQKKLFFKPLKSKSKAVIIDAPLGFTTEAQSALLKVLEEPPQNTFIFIIVQNKNLLLETVLSRCKIIETEDMKNFSKDELLEFSEIVGNLDSMGIGNKLRLAQDFGKSREEALIFLEKLIASFREKLINAPYEQRALQNLKKFQEIYSVVKTTNTTPRLTLENLFISL
ncbi:MAG: hypothetical protein WD967_01120 [Candidatus Levyibacteriota bacterium]